MGRVFQEALCAVCEVMEPERCIQVESHGKALIERGYTAFSHLRTMLLGDLRLQKQESKKKKSKKKNQIQAVLSFVLVNP